jgi:hypothetical protein
VYFVEEHNINTLALRYHIDQHCPSSDLKIFQSGGKTVGASTPCELEPAHRKSAFLYMFTNVEEMDEYFV